MRQVRQEQLPQKREMLRVCSAQAPLRGHQHCCGRAGSAGTDGPAGRDRAWTSHCARRGLKVELARGQAGPRMVACRADDDGRSPAASPGAAAATPWRWRADGAWAARYSAAASGTSWRWRTTRTAPPCCYAGPRPCRAGMHCSGSTGGNDHGYGSGSNCRDASTGSCHATKSGVARFRHADGRSRPPPTRSAIAARYISARSGGYRRPGRRTCAGGLCHGCGAGWEPETSLPKLNSKQLHAAYRVGGGDQGSGSRGGSAPPTRYAQHVAGAGTSGGGVPRPAANARLAHASTARLVDAARDGGTPRRGG